MPTASAGPAINGVGTDGITYALPLNAGGTAVLTTGGGPGGAVTIADGADVAEGAIADAAVVGDVSGTLSAKLRGISKILNSVWSSANSWLQVSIQNATLAVTFPTSSTAGAPAQTAVSSSASTILASNAGRKRFTVQNTGVTPVYVALGGTNPTVTAYTFALAPGSFADDASGPIYSDTIWTGAVRAICAVSGTVVITEFT